MIADVAADSRPDGSSGWQRTSQSRCLHPTDSARVSRPEPDRIITITITMIIHLMVLMLLGLIPMPEISGETVMSLIAQLDDANDLDKIELIDVPVMPEKLLSIEANSVMKQAISDMEQGITSDQLDSILERDITLPVDELSSDLDIPVHLGELGGRSTAGKQAALRRFGGNAESEKSVNSGLRWLASVQRDDGSWSFDDVGDSGSPGALQRAQMGATSLSLLCFLVPAILIVQKALTRRP